MNGEKEVIAGIKVELSAHPHFDEMLPMFRKMHLAERCKAANWMVTFASSKAMEEELEQRAIDERNDHDPLNDYERHPGVITYKK